MRILLGLICVAIGAGIFYYDIYSLYNVYNERLFWPLIFCIGCLYGLHLFWRKRNIGWWVFTLMSMILCWILVEKLQAYDSTLWIWHIAASTFILPFYNLRTEHLKMQKVGTSLFGLLGVKWFVAILTAIGPLYRLVNRFAIHNASTAVRSRPHPTSTVHNFVSWKGLTDKSYSARHVEADPEFNAYGNLPHIDSVAELFERDGDPILCPKSTLLFPTFAQYLTDGFIRTRSDVLDINDPNESAKLKQNTSNHDIDLCPLYGLNESQTNALRVDTATSDRRGHLKTQTINGEDYAPFLFQTFDDNRPIDDVNLPIGMFPDNDTKLRQALYNQGIEITPGFEGLDVPLGVPRLINTMVDDDDSQRDRNFAREQILHLFAFGGDRANSATQTAMMNTLLIREHNRLAKAIGAAHVDWSDDRVFETARNVVIVEFIKVVVNDYINHIAPMEFKLDADPKAAWKAGWNRPNWITTEFSLLYRWHGLIPDEIRWGDVTYPAPATFMNNMPLIKNGLAKGFEDMAAQPAGRLGPRNTTKGLMFVERLSVAHGRACELASYNGYRDYMGRDPVTSFKDISSHPATCAKLEEVYGDVDKVEFFSGIFCEDRVPNSPLPSMVLVLVAVDAFTQALTNPLFSEHVFKESSFSKVGWEAINTMNSLEDLVRRNKKVTDSLGPISMTRADWKREKSD